ncbi:hypothetical protein [Streptomyces sp. NPDC059564]|uniref:hypothetical protein n=1 Tax=Streptomyces sp. NPDC059564 TaxID=3346865 RepID=UPI0036C8736C
MSESFPQSEQPGQAPEGGDGKRRGLSRVVPRRTGARWAAAGVAAAVIVGGGAAAVAVAEHHDGRGKGSRSAWSEADHEGAPGHAHGGERKGPKPVPPKLRDGAAGLGGAAKKAPAPAPLPSLAIGQAAEKAAGAVAGGKVESLRPVAQDGGGSAWLAVVLAPDGVRHAVTVSGTDGTITANVPVNGHRAR